MSATSDTVTIGKPVPNVSCYVLMHGSTLLQPIGIPGELCCGGCQIARGYLKRPELTAEKFVKNPFYEGADNRIYRSGDMVSWTSNGEIIFIGRFDFQVKLRGFRIELGEVEAALQNAGANLSLALVENQQLVAAVSPDLDARQLKKTIAKSLPPYMVPSKLLTMAELPMTQNGKIDRDALKRLLAGAGEDDVTQFVAPRSVFEERIANVVQEVLGVERIGVTDDLKAAGLSSLKAVRLVAKLREIGAHSISLTELYQAVAIENIVTIVEQLHRVESLQIVGAGDENLDTTTRCSAMLERAAVALISLFQILAWMWMSAVIIFPILVPVELAGIMKDQVAGQNSPIFAFILLALGFFGLPLYIIGVALGVVITKWIVVGQYKERTIKIGTWAFFQWWFVDRLYDVASAMVLGHLRGGPIHYYFLRLLGLKARSYCYIEAKDIKEWDLITFEGGDAIAEGCVVRAGVMEEGQLHLRSIVLVTMYWSERALIFSAELVLWTM